MAYTKLRDRTLHLPAAMAPVNSSMIENTYQRGMDILEQSHRAGCDVTQDRQALRLNYGLFVANQDDWSRAAAILQPIVMDTPSNRHDNVVWNNAKRLYDMCVREIPFKGSN
uniref:Uncharacterized protein n=1 Tax=Entomoneis paludosa TaxID=265537 RepID=A0A7S3DXL3_9STRA